MNENFLHYIWRHSLYNFNNIRTFDGRDLKIVHPGYPHQDAGPDFKEAIVRIDDILWAGDVEIHISSSDWYKHNHDQDLKYQSVILHVVYEHNSEVYYENSEAIPVLELKPHLPQKLLDEYHRLTLSGNELPCKAQLPDIPALQFTSFLSSLVMERLLRKQEHVMSMLRSCRESWDEVLYRMLAIAFGFKTNTAGFEELAKSLPFKYLQTHENVKIQLESLLFGQSGMLDVVCEDDYPQLLYQEYQYLKYKYRLIPIHKKSWNYLRIRPVNFPSLRIAQLAALLYEKGNLFTLCSENREVEYLKSLLFCSADSYWKTHHSFDTQTTERSVSLGANAIQLLIINAVIPVLFSYGAFQGKENLQIEALSLLENLEFEENRITKFYRAAGFPSRGALFSQAIIELRNMYCSKKLCQYCRIGKFILKGNL